LFVFSSDRMAAALDGFRAFVARLPVSSEIFYSYKTNYLPALCQQLADAGIGAEVTSAVEWALATRYQEPTRIVVNGIGKCAGGLLRQIVANPDQVPRLVNLETDTEVDLVTRRPGNIRPLPVGLRITVPEISGERGRDPSEHWRRGVSKFGWPVDGDAVVSVARRLAAVQSVDLQGLHVHFGSQLVSPRRYDTVLRRIGQLLQRLHRAGITVTTLDLGGGLASGWVDKRRTGPLFDLLAATGLPVPAATQRIADLDAIVAVIARHAPDLTRLGIDRLVFEPGRFLAEPSMLAIARVLGLRRDGDRSHAVVDIGTNVLRCWRGGESRPVVFDLAGDGPDESVELVGPSCHRSDTFGAVTAPGRLVAGGLVCFDAVGAYTHGDWVANAWPRPAVYSDSGTLLWAAQSGDDLLRPANVAGVGHVG
jgi:diaminopimelate decarboxylase